MRPQYATLLAAAAAVVAAPNSTCNGLGFYLPNVTSPTRFNISVNPKLINLARERAALFRTSRGFSDEWTNEGPPSDAMARLAYHWAKEYDWEKVQETINDFEHFVTTVPGNRNYTADIPLHFVHKKSNSTKATPILLIHGWGSTHQEWTRVIEPLSERGFHVVAVDLPGFGFSPAPTQAGLGPREMGIAYDMVMRQLGYDSYGLITTDLGLSVGIWMTIDVPNSIIGQFADFFFLEPTAADLSRQAQGQTTQEENDYIAAIQEFDNNHFSYAAVQGQKPLALSLSMADSPVGFAGWLWDLKHAISDGYEYSLDEVITDALMLWIQTPFGSMRAYKEILVPAVLSYPKTTVPTGITEWGSANGPFPKLVKYPLAPRDWIDRRVNVTYFKAYEFGGHFPARTHPEQWVADVREFFSAL